MMDVLASHTVSPITCRQMFTLWDLVLTDGPDYLIHDKDLQRDQSIDLCPPEDPETPFFYIL